jgi:hydroxyacylglutathione hydrolase
MRVTSLFSRTGFSNTYLVAPDNGPDAVVVDPGSFGASLLQAIESQGLYARSILVTHAHNAHISGIRGLLKVYQASLYANQPSVLDFPAQALQDGDSIEISGLPVRVIATPGHSLDSLNFLVGTLLFTGDTLTAGSIGSTRDGYARGLLLENVRRKLLSLGDEVIVLPGHGPPSKVGIEKLYNPWLGEKL